MTKKNVFLLLLGITSLQGFSQLLPNDTNTTDNKYRSGGLSIGYSSLPSFANSYKFNVLGNSIFDGRINIVNSDNDTNKNSLVIWGTNNQNTPAQLSIAVATCDGCYSQISKKGDGILRGNTSGSLILSNDGTGDIKLVTRESATDQVRMLIDKYGKVGIGNENPEYELDVNGDIRAGRASFSKSIPNGTVFSDPNQELIESNVLSAGTIVDPTNNSKTFNFFDFGSNQTKPARIWFSLQNRNDAARLVYSGQENGSGYFCLFNKTQQEFLKVNEDGSDNVYLQMGKPNSRVIIGGYSDYPNSLGHKLFVQAGSAKVEGNILTDANIGIGTSNFTDGAETYRLSVKGKVRAEEVKIYTTWADYVFEKGYQLPTLQEVEKHIEEKGHLINMPSGKEVEENGLSLGEISKLQQEKIEELTLYLIQQQKEIEALKQQMKDLLEKK